MIKAISHHLLRDLAARKNLDFRRSMLGKTLSVVTLDTLNNPSALSDNYIKVSLASPRPTNRIVDVRIGAETADGLAEAGAFSILR